MMVLQQWTGWSGARKRYYNYICSYNLLKFPMRQGEALPETLPYHFNIIDTRDTLILL
jgi:hypothetical protein